MKIEFRFCERSFSDNTPYRGYTLDTKLATWVGCELFGKTQEYSYHNATTPNIKTVEEAYQDLRRVHNPKTRGENSYHSQTGYFLPKDIGVGKEISGLRINITENIR